MQVSKKREINEKYAVKLCHTLFGLDEDEGLILVTQVR
jgi:hypothetical protein